MFHIRGFCKIWNFTLDLKLTYTPAPLLNKGLKHNILLYEQMLSRMPILRKNTVKKNEAQRVDQVKVRTYEVRMNAQREFQTWLKFLDNKISETQFY